MTEETRQGIVPVSPELQRLAGGIAVGQRGIEIRNMADLATFAKTVYQSGLAPAHFESSQAVFVAIQMGMELGLAPLASLRTIAVIQGRPSLWGDGMKAVVEASGQLAWMTEHLEGLDANGAVTDLTVAVCRVQRIGKVEADETLFSVTDAKKAELWSKKGTWQQYPKRMLQMRARAFRLRDTFPDILCGMLSAEEAQDLERFDPSKAAGAPQDPSRTARLAQKLASEIQEIMPQATVTLHDPEETVRVAPKITHDDPDEDESDEDRDTDDMPELVKERLADLAGIAADGGVSLEDALAVAELWLKRMKWGWQAVSNDELWTKLILPRAKKQQWVAASPSPAA